MSLAADTEHGHHTVRCPAQRPHGDVSHGHLGDPDLDGAPFVDHVGPQYGDVHAARLLPQHPLVLPHGVHDVEVEETDGDERHDEEEHDARPDVGGVGRTAVQVVEGTRVEDALGNVSAGADVQQRQHGEDERVAPDAGDDGGGAAHRQRRHVQRQHDDAVAVPADGHQAEDAAQTADGAQEAVGLAGAWPEPPAAARERVVDEHRVVGGHHQVRDGHVGHQHVGRRAQSLVVQEQVERRQVGQHGDHDCRRRGCSVTSAEGRLSHLTSRRRDSSANRRHFGELTRLEWCLRILNIVNTICGVGENCHRCTK